MTWDAVFAGYDRQVLSRAELMAAGATGASLTAAVRYGYLNRLRRDHYCLPTLHDGLQKAVRVGGVATCVTALASMDVFAFDVRRTHVHLERDASRQRHPSARTRRLRHGDTSSAVRHWRPTQFDRTETAVSIADALIDTFVCVEPVLALASIDNALHLKLIDSVGVAHVFAALPAHLQQWRRRVNGLAEAGQETVLRELVRDLGLGFEVQYPLPAGRRGDLLVEGCLLLEADSRLAHDGWEKHVEDRRRDLMAASLGFMSLRPAYQHTMHNPDQVRSAILGLLASRDIYPRVARRHSA